jgi:hypothetical protein
MGGGSWNGKNFGGMHTGANKGGKRGPYSSNGYTRGVVSHKGFRVGDAVTYTGTNKNKSQYYIPNGTKGVIVTKDNSQKQFKTPRSMLCVDFEEQGVRYVRKEVLQKVSDFQNNLQRRIDLQNIHKGHSQSERREGKKATREQQQSHKYQTILENRKSHKDYREWRKEFLDDKKTALQEGIRNIEWSDQFKTLQEERKKILKKLETIDEKYSPTNEPGYRLDYIKEHTSDTMTKEQADEMYRSHKENAMRKRKLNTRRLKDIKNTMATNSASIRKLTKTSESPARDFFRNECSSAYDYQKMLHSNWDKHRGVESTPSVVRDYVVDPTTKPTQSFNTELLQWGLYPRMVQ